MTSLAALDKRGRELQNAQFSDSAAESFALRSAGPRDLRLETSASGSVPAPNEDFARQLAALQRSTTLDLSGSDEEEVDLPDTDVHLRALAQRYSARISGEEEGQQPETERFEKDPIRARTNALLAGGPGRPLAESATNLEEYGMARTMSPARRMAELQGVGHFGPGGAGARKPVRKSYMDTIRAPGAQNVQKAQGYINSEATPKLGQSRGSRRPEKAEKTKKAQKPAQDNENAGLTERQQRMSLSQLLGGEESAAQVQSAEEAQKEAGSEKELQKLSFAQSPDEVLEKQPKDQPETHEAKSAPNPALEQELESLRAENKKLVQQLAEKDQRIKELTDAAEAAKQEQKLAAEQSIREKTAELTARLEQLTAELKERDKALETREALLGEAGTREKAAGLERKNYEALLAAKDARVQVVEKQKLALAAQAEQLEALLKTFSGLEKPAYVLLGVFARRPPSDRLDSQTFRVLRAARALV